MDNQIGFYKKRFVPLTSDAGFKAVFIDHSNKDLLIGLLNHLLPDGVKVENIVEYCDREQQQDTVFSKRAVLDLVCKGPYGTLYVVEIQKKCYKAFFERLEYYGAGTYSKNLLTGNDYFKLRPVHVVSIIDHRLEHDDESLWDTDRLVSHYIFMEMRTKELASTTISINFAELKRFTKCAEDCRSELDCPLYWFIHSGDIDTIPETIAKSDFVSRLADATKLASMTPDRKSKFESEIMNELDIAFQKRQEREEGIEIGFDKGIIKGREDVARKFKAMGIPVGQIAQGIGLTEEQGNGSLNCCYVKENYQKDRPNQNSPATAMSSG